MAVVDAFQHWVYAEASLNVTTADLDAQMGGAMGSVHAGD